MKLEITLNHVWNETLFKLGERIMAVLDELKQEVAETKEINQSAVTLIQGLAAKIEELKTDPAALAALAAELNESSNALAAAVAAQTPPVDPPVA